MKIRNLFSILLATFTIGVCGESRAADVIKADNADNLDLGTSWLGGTPPTSADVAVWNSTITVANTTLLGVDTNWAGIRIANPADAVTISAGNTLTIGASGIDMSAATTNLTLANSNILSVEQTWNVTNGLTLTASGGIGGTAVPLTKTGDGTLILSVGSPGWSGGITVNSGILQANSGTALGATSGGITNNNGTTLRINTTTTIGNPPDVNGAVTVDLNNVAGNEGLNGAWSGEGTVTFISQQQSNRIMTIGGGSGGNMNNFSGTLNFGTNSGVFRYNDGGGSPNLGSSSATFNLGTGSVTNWARNRGVTIQYGALLGGPNTTIRHGTSSSGTTTFSIGALNTSTLFEGGFLDGGSGAPVAITKVGSGTLTLSGGNSTVGTTTISAGTLQIGNASTTGQLGSGPIVNNASLNYNRSDALSVSNAISGSGTLTLIGGNAVTFDGTNTSSGSLVISNGSAVVGLTGAISCPINVLSNGTFDVSVNTAFALNQTLSGSGTVTGLLAVASGTISPGGSGAAGTLTFVSGLSESNNINNQFELSSPGDTNDLIVVTGDLTLGGTNNINVTHFGGGSTPSGTYTLFTYSGILNGDLTNLAVTIVGATATLTNPPGAIELIVTPPSRGASNLTWVGDAAANAWDSTTSNWVNGVTYYKFQAGDFIFFDNTGVSNSPVNIPSPGGVQPDSITVDSTGDYTITGAGGINGTASLTKTNTGKLTMLATNAYTGPTVVSSGTLEVQYLANGNSASAIGASTSVSTNLVISDSTFRYTGSSAGFDRNAIVNGNVTIDIDSANLTFNGSLSGTAALTKFGAGTLTLSVANTYSGGTTISNGVIALGSNIANNDGAGGSALGATNNPVTFYGGTLQLFGYNGSTGLPGYSTLYNPLIVPAGQSGTLRMFSRGTTPSGLRSSLTGSGTFNLVVNYVRDNLDGDWSAFTGLINVTAKAGADEMRINNNFGYSNASIYLDAGVTMARVGTANATVDIGELGGASSAVIAQGNQNPPNSTPESPTWRVGWKNTDATFAGVIADDGTTSIIKVGTGKWTLSGTSIYTGATTISNGTLQVDGALGATPVTVYATLIGNGTLGGTVTVESGGTLSPGASIGQLTIGDSLTLLVGGTNFMEIDKSNGTNDFITAANSITYGGTLVVTNLGGTLAEGDRFKVFDSASYSGAFDSLVLPPVTIPLSWDTTRLTVDGTIGVIIPRPAITSFGIVGSQFVLTGTNNGTYSPNYYVLTTTNLNLPASNWTILVTNAFELDGTFSFTNNYDALEFQRYYNLHTTP